jgi:tRNA threonylcarbamoyladenosine biosynthesis protein TsaB
MTGTWLILETAGRAGLVGLARDGAVVRSARLDETRRHARDLAATVASVLSAVGLAAKDLTGVAVGTGPGSYTGLRVGVATAKVLAYAVGCRLVAVPTFRSVVERVPEGYSTADVIGDALQGHVYVQRFRRIEAGWSPADALRIEAVGAWAANLPAESVVTGPGVAVHDAAIPPGVVRVAADRREPTADAVFAAGRGLAPLTRDEVFRLEPLYLRGSSAEEKAKRDGATRPGDPAG